MTKLEYLARISWTETDIILDSVLTGHPPRHSERPFATIQTWGMGRPDASLPEGIWLLLNATPHYDFLPVRAAGSSALAGELRRRGIPELDAADVKTEADRRALKELETEVQHTFGVEGNRVWHELQSEPNLRMHNVRAAVVRLSKGDLTRLTELIEAARTDWRDVLALAQKERLL
jgi:hypothetical protein